MLFFCTNTPRQDVQRRRAELGLRPPQVDELHAPARAAHHRPDVIKFDESGILVIPSPPDLETLLPHYYRTAKLASFQRQLNNFGYHRLGWSPTARGAPAPTALKYHKVVGEAMTRPGGLLELRPLSRRKRDREAPPAARARSARREPTRGRTQSDANAAMLLMSCSSVPAPNELAALGEAIAA